MPEAACDKNQIKPEREVSKSETFDVTENDPNMSAERERERRKEEEVEIKEIQRGLGLVDNPELHDMQVGKVPQAGESSGKPSLGQNIRLKGSDEGEEQIDCRLARSEQLSLEELLNSKEIDKASIPYYQEVYEDILNGDESWGVTKKVREYADYLRSHPETVVNLPPIEFLGDKLHDGAHRISAIYLLSKLYPDSNWTKVKFKVDFYEEN